ncbi:MAG: cytochrome c maturation protein CcmE [Nitrospiria bacterium]
MKWNKKVGVVLSVLVIAAALGYLIFGNFGKNLVYFFTPSEVAAFTQDHYHKKLRVAGLVVKQSVKVDPETKNIRFELTDGVAVIPVTFEGIPPDLFKEGQGAVVEGYWDSDKRLHSQMIMAKHSEDYMPPDMKKGGGVLPKKDFYKTLQLN